jgi:late competence protein required for DNA uptake (superfamily II DNA/RNA helicase)
LAGSEKLKSEHPEQMKNERAPPLQVQADDKKRKLQSMAETEHLSGQLVDDNQALKRCKEEFIEEDHAAMQQMMSAVEAVARCSICCDTMKHASTVSGCGHTFCRSCIEEALRVTGCCPEYLLPAWRRDIMDSRRVEGVMEVVGLKL